MMHSRDFTASGVATHKDAGQLLDQFCARFAEHVTITRSEAGARLDTVIGSADIAVSKDRLDIKLRCPTAAMLFTIRSMVAENLFELSTSNTLALDWADGPQPSAIPNFREIRVVDAYDITRTCAASSLRLMMPGISSRAACMRACSFRRKAASRSGRIRSRTAASIGRRAMMR